MLTAASPALRILTPRPALVLERFYHGFRSAKARNRFDMSAKTNGVAPGAESGKKLKILMLHGMLYLNLNTSGDNIY
jgi:hypothetical protein